MTEKDEKAPASLDTELGRAVVERGLATEADVAECRAEQQRLAREANSHKTLAAVMLDKGVVTRRQVDRVKRSLEAARSSQQIPGFRILARLGSGAMATVFKARQESLDREVAIKVLPRKYSENREYVERFYKEGRAAAKLNHANIVQAIDVGEAGGYHYFVMEYVEGHTLYDDLTGGRKLPEREALRIVLQIARALAHAHERGMIHRDVKPKNIMITRDGRAKLADMGLARMAADEQAAQAEAGKAYGTPYYIAPEQIRGKIDIDGRADIYGLGATFYHMVTGRVPYTGDDSAEIMRKHLREKLVPPDHINTALSAGTSEVIEIMMSKRREDRYNDVEELLADLESLREGKPPLRAHQRIDVSMLEQLEEGDVVQTEEQQYGEELITRYRVAVLILGTVSAIAVLIIALMLAL